MAVKNNLNFDLLLKKEGKKYEARVMYSPAGQAAANFSLSLSELRSKWQVGPKTYGKFLFTTVFKDSVGKSLRISKQIARKEDSGLCIRLRFDKNTDQFLNQPWELLYDPESSNYLALSSNTSIVRYLEVMQPEKSLSVLLPLRILVMISIPVDEYALNANAEFKKLEDSLQELISRNQVILDKVPIGRQEALQEKLRKNTYDIFHYIGHGGFDVKQKKGYLLLEDKNHFSVITDADTVGSILGDHSSLRLAFLNACQGATSSQEDTFSGTAQKLVKEGLPAVIAMQSAIEDKSASVLAGAFYKSLSDGYPVDAALTEARKELRSKGKKSEWAIPVLFMRTPDGHLFDINSTLEEAGFFKPKTEKSSFDISSELLDCVYNNKIVILYKTRLQADIKNLARYIAWHMNDRSDHDLSTLEWTASNEDDTLISILAKIVSQPTIFIFDNISPKNINYDLSSLNLTVEKGHFLILTTEGTKPKRWSRITPKMYKIV